MADGAAKDSHVKASLGKDSPVKACSVKEGSVKEGSVKEGSVKEGAVKEYDLQRGQGVITADSGEELSVHRNDLVDVALQGLYANDLVEYVIGRNRFGRRCAQQVRRVGWDESADPEAPPREWSF